MTFNEWVKNGRRLVEKAVADTDALVPGVASTSLSNELHPTDALPYRAKRIPGRYGRYADWQDIYTLLGVKGKNLPPEGMPEREIHGVRVYVKPLPPKTGRRRNWNGLRVMAICECGKHVAVGRLHQHRH